MRTLHFRSVERRRTVRVTLCVELIVQGSTENNGRFKVKARTLSVSRHGGMIVMDLEVAMGQKLVQIRYVPSHHALSSLQPPDTPLFAHCSC